MVKIELAPDLEHCIETVAKKKYAELTQIMLSKEGSDWEMEEKLQLLRLFLEKADFRRLRAQSEKHLTEGRRVAYRIYLDKNELKVVLLFT